MMYPTLTFCSLLLLSSCSFEQETKEETLFKNKIDKMNMESFNLPDSINTALIIATSYDPANNAHIFFMYDDTTKHSVKKVDFLSDSTSAVENLVILKLNEFRSATQNVDYVISDKGIDIVHVRNHGGAMVPQSRHLKRSDRD